MTEGGEAVQPRFSIQNDEVPKCTWGGVGLWEVLRLSDSKEEG